MFLKRCNTPNSPLIVAFGPPRTKTGSGSRTVLCYTENMELHFSTKGFNEILDITPPVQKAVQQSGLQEGVAHLFVAGSTAALTTIEYERGALADLQRALDQIAPMDADYEHNRAWGDGNGYAHLRAALLKPSLCVPIQDGKLALGTWQQIILMDFDNRPRERKVLLTLTDAVHP